ncbi:MAG: Asp23/Gls24 family envelope stress response protein [Clostridia bacterium]|nr:Asp23/Gls24 family envelope stress response protein [Clostridia bacterium]
MEENKTLENTNSVKISDDVVQIIAGIAAGEIEGVYGMSNSFAGGIAELLGSKKSVSRGVKVEISDGTAVIDMHIIVRYGARIPDVAWKIQEKVKDEVESLTGLSVEKVNIHIDGIHIEKETAQEEEEEKTEE